MKAMVYHAYGSPDVIVEREVAKPSPGQHEVLIKIRAASVNPYDWHFLRGEPYFLRLMTGLARPKFTRFGVDAAGSVEAVGSGVMRMKIGDEVFGACRGAFAEYACGAEKQLAIKPQAVTFEQAASVPIAALTALQAFRDKGHLRPEHNILINGAAGGVGTFAVQIANSFGAKVTGVCSSRNVELVRSLGADHVVDYAHDDFTKGEARYDIILDLVGNHSLSACGRILNPQGIYIGAGGQAGRWMLAQFGRMIAAPVLSGLGGRKFVSILAKMTTEDLAIVGELIASGKVTAVIDRRYSLHQLPEAIRYLEEGHARGKVVISMD